LSAAGPGVSRRRRWPWLVVGLAVLVAALAAWPPSRVAFQTAALVPALLDAGPQPLALAPPPIHHLVTYTAPDGAELPADLWLPASASPQRPVGAVIFVSGINSVGRAHPALARVASAMARTGAAVLVPELPVFFENQVDASEVGRIVAAFEALAERAEVDPDRIGIVAISVGGSLALIAAADPAIADRLDWVAAFGAYADAGQIMTEVTSHQYRLDAGLGGGTADWEPTLLVRQVVFGLVIGRVTDGRDHGYLYGAYDGLNTEGVHPFPDADIPLVTAAGRTAEALLLAETLPAAEAVLATAPPEVLAFLDEISPIHAVAGIQARVYLMHDVGDRHIPFVHAHRLFQAMTDAGVDVRFGEFRLFDHVTPQTADLLAAAPEVSHLFWYVREIAAEVL
jgi:acetyl esterase/lipase